MIGVPVAAVGRTAVAVGGLADSGLVVGVSRSRAWIVLVGVLLGGIVALNVLGLSLSSAGSDTAAKIDELQSSNSVLRARIANRLSSDKVESAAAALGLGVPAPDEVHYLGSSRRDARVAAERLASGAITVAPPAASTSTDEVATADPALADPAVADPAATTSQVVAPATSAASAPVTDPASGAPAAAAP